MRKYMAKIELMIEAGYREEVFGIVKELLKHQGDYRFSVLEFECSK